MGWKESKRAQGFKDLLVWLEPAAVEALERLKAASPGASAADIISKAVILAAGSKLPDTAGHVAGGPDPEVARVKNQLAAVELRVTGIENEVQRLAQSSQSSVSSDDFFSLVERFATLADKIDLLEAQPAVKPNLPTPRKGRGKFDEAFLLAAIADRIERDGEKFVVADLHRDLVGEGVQLHTQPSNFWTFYNNHRADVSAILAKRQAERQAVPTTEPDAS
jgi:hypothetical protein